MISLYQILSRRLVTIYCTCVILFVLFIHVGHRHPSFPRTASHSNHQPSKGRHLLDDASNSTLGFQKILVINLPSRSDRRDLTSLAARLTGLEVEYVDGVTDLDEKAWPPGAEKSGLKRGSLAAWRSHMNAVRLIVEHNTSSALVLEDDVDWDVRIKSQMHDFAKASRLLVQPLAGTKDRFLDPTWPQPDEHHQKVVNLDIKSASTGEPTTSPYGDLDRWDVLWLGHCGCRFPRVEDKNVPIGRAVISDDETVPARYYINKEFGDDKLMAEYPDHTRVVSRARVNTCTLAYALSQNGARQILYELGVHQMDGPYDLMIRSLCHGDSGRDLLTCLSPQPGIFNHHRPAGPRSKFSNIGDEHDEGYNDVPVSTNIRWATKVNLKKLIKGETNYTDSFPDEE